MPDVSPVAGRSAHVIRPFVWLFVVLVLLAVAERRIAQYAHGPTVELQVENGDAPKGETIFQALLIADTARPPAAITVVPVQKHEHLVEITLAGIALSDTASRSPPAVPGTRRLI